MTDEKERIRALLKEVITAYRQCSSTKELIEAVALVSERMSDATDLCDDTEHVPARDWLREQAGRIRKAESDYQEMLKSQDQLAPAVSVRYSRRRFPG